MKPQKSNRFWQVHSLLGIVLGLPLFVIFVAGTLAFLEPEAINWTQAQYATLPAEQKSLNPAIDALIEKYPKTDEISVVFATDQHPVTDVFLEENHEHTHFWLDPHSMEVSIASDHDTDIFHFFVDLHYFNFIPFGQEAAGVIAALFFTIIITGLVYQWRRMRKDIHPRNLSLEGKSRWKNIHRFTSLLTLPFQAVFSITGAALAMGLLLAAPAVYLFFDGEPDALNEALFPAQMAKAEPTSKELRFPVDEALAKAVAQWPADVTPWLLQIAHQPAGKNLPASNTIIVQGKSDGVHLVGTHLLTLDGDLNILHQQSPTSHPGPMMIEGLVNLHFGTFNALFIKGLFIITGLIVSLSIAAGVCIFLQRRLQNVTKRSRSTKALSVLTYWCLGGLPIAMALSLHAAQLAPEIPVHVFALATALTLVTTLIFKKPLPCYAMFSASAFAALPLSFAIAQKQSPVQFGSTHSMMVTLFNVFFVLTAISIYWLKIRLSRPQEPDSQAA